jgi:hypothetical protein
MAVVRRFAVAGLEVTGRRGRRGGMVIVAIDETGQEKAGEATASGRAVQAAQRASIGGGFRQHGPAPIRKRPAPVGASGQA